MTVEAEYRLPRTVIPSRYELTLAPDLGSASFTGTEVVDVIVTAPTNTVELNAIELEISGVEMVSSDYRHAASSITYDAERERAIFTFDQDLSEGDWQLHAKFSGILNDDLHGFYRSTYKDADGNQQVIATTQFEATDARRAFPCWDEPDLKATFAVTLVVDEGLVAVSNASEIAIEPAGDGKVAHRFAETMKMATYLVAFIVGDFEISGPVPAAGVPLRVLHTPGKGHLADFALEAGAFALDYLATYYDIPYPGDKLDMIGVPDFAWGAMENLGAVTYRETALLVDRKRATQDELARVADIIAHELAHMWFGDLVTMKWWNGIWLNEAFATFMELKCVDAFRADWNRWLSFAHFRSTSMDVDGLTSTRPVEFPVASPAEANEMFDTLTYGKGSAVLRMLEQYLGEETFRRGISRYLKKHAYANTETDDLWEALEAESGEPVGEIMSGWIYQGGYPQLDVTATEDGYRLEQRQFRFLGGGDATWQVPVLYRSGREEDRVVVDDGAVVPSTADNFLANRGGDGFYRINYPSEMLANHAEGFSDLAPAERYTLIADSWANVLAGNAPAQDFIGLVGALRGETEPDVWGAAIGGLAELSRVISSDDRPALQQFVRDLASGQAADMGWSPDEGEGDLQRSLRGLLLRTMANLGDDVAIQETARDVFDQSIEDRDSVDADVADAATAIVAAHGGRAEFDRFLELRAGAASPLEEVRFLRAAAAVPDKETAGRLVEMILAGEVRSQDANWLLARLLGHRDTGPTVWCLVKEHWDAILASMPPQNRRRMLDLIMHRSEPDVAADIAAWLEQHPIGGADKYTAQQMERLQIRVGLREREGERLGSGLGDLA
ncbi:MAG: M1 family metallopeptidase [Acidimicrobiia bacterium]|nr:M1 family metallopeptidase [Acidimicrobiia bacterium]MDX2465962.1 M1 family metallopeptidase [Acidimicrobiia bacterium]